MSLVPPPPPSAHIKRYHVFPSFHGPDVRKGFLGHLHKQLESKGITTFKDQEIERGLTIGPELVQAIRESRVSIVVLSKKYASSSWCLDELVEILKCKKYEGQIVMTVFYDVDPSHVRKQIGDFGIAFEKTCRGKTEEVKLRWGKALACAAEIAGEHSLNWDYEGEMIEKIVADVSNNLNLTPSKDFEGMVGLEAHLKIFKSLLCLECGDVKMIGIWGPAGIGKTTVARALYNQLSTSFPLRCFLGNLKGSDRSIGVDEYEMKLYLQNQLLSKVLNQKNVKIHHLGAIREWLHNQKVLIVLDDVDDVEKLEVLAKQSSWFGPGSRIIITTEDKKILEAHGISDIYHVDYPSKKEALEIFCLAAFRQSSPQDGFIGLANKVANLCGNLPLGLRVVGSLLRGETKAEWELQLIGLETSLDRRIEDILRVGYDKLSKKHQSIFLHIACFFNNENLDYVTSILADSNLDIRNGLKMLARKSLVHISTDGKIVMHKLLQQFGRQEVIEQSMEPGKRQFLVEPGDILNVLANETGTESVKGISLDMSKSSDMVISGRAFAKMCNLQFLRVFMGNKANVRLVHILGDMEYLPRLKLLRWDSYQGPLLPPTFRTECLIELHMPSSKLKRLWGGGIQPLASLKKVNLNFSYKLKEIPDLSKATNLEVLTLIQCTSLVDFPSYLLDLQKLGTLRVWGCKKLRVVPMNNINSASPATEVRPSYCSGFRNFPDISMNTYGGGREREEVPPSFKSSLSLRADRPRYHHASWSDAALTRKSRSDVNLSYRDIKVIPNYVRRTHQLHTLVIKNCRYLVSVAGLPSSLKYLHVENCGSLERVALPIVFQQVIKELIFHNCLKLDEESRRGIVQHRYAEYVCLPGIDIPPEFTHRATGHCITISSSGRRTFFASARFKACLLLSPINDGYGQLHITCYLRSKGNVLVNEINHLHLTSDESPMILVDHLFIFRGDLIGKQNKVDDESMREILFEFHSWSKYQIVACGVRILREEDENRITEMDDDSSLGGAYEAEDFKVVSQVENIKSGGYTSCWSWLMKLFGGGL